MPSQRIQQINSFIKDELSAIILKEVELPLGCLATITKAAASPDLKTAVVWLSVLPEIHKTAAIKIFSRERKNIQRILNSRFTTRNTPQISFKLDETEEKADRINRLLDSL